MCGIAGVISFSSDFSREGCLASVRGMLDSVKHRGPDSSIATEPATGIILGYNRLRITDHLNIEADSPPLTPDGRFTLALNGELYDFKSRRDSLLAKGHVFKTAGDSEVFLHSWLDDGDVFLRRARGMFAACLVDKKQRTLSLVVDHFGQKPMYYMEAKDAFWFCSELTPLLRIPGISLTPDLPAIAEFIHQRYIRGRDTHIQEIKRVLPGERIDVSAQGVTKSRYYTIPPSKVSETSNEDIYQAIHLNCDLVSRSEIPSVVLFSGGLDSSIVLYELAKAGRCRQAASVRFTPEITSQATQEETASAHALATSLGISLSELVLSRSDYFSWLDKWLDAMQLPIACQEGPCSMALLNSLSSSYRVAYCGTGPDEVLDGYNQLAEHEETLEEFAERFTSKYNWLFSVEFQKLISDPKYKRFSVDKLLQDLPPTDPGVRNPLFLTQMANVRGRLPTLELAQMDIAGMRSSVEVRSPLVDVALFEAAFSLKSNDCRSLDRDKVILRRAYEDKLPSAVLNQQKLGFPISDKLWSAPEFYPYVESVLDQGSRIDKLGIINTEYLRELWDRNSVGDRNIFFRLSVLEHALQRLH